MMATINEALKTGGREAGTSVTEQARQPVPFYQECYDDGGTFDAMNLVRLEDPWVREADLAMFCDPAERSRLHLASMVELSRLAVTLGMEVFGFSLDGCRRTFRVAWERSTRIAFNKGGEIFLNCAYSPTILRAESRSAEEAASEWHFWFMVVCHE